MRPRAAQSYRAYLLRCWHEGKAVPGEAPAWRFSLEEVAGERRRRGFVSLEALVAFLRAELTVEIIGDQGVTDLVLLGWPVPEIEAPPPEPDLEVPDHQPALAVDGDGKAHLVWQRGEEVWHAVYTGGAFTATQPISGALGVDPAVAYGPTLIEGTSPGLAVVWQAGYGNDAHLAYAQGRPDGSDVYAWTVPISLTTDAYGDIAPSVVVTDGATPLVLWLQRDWSLEDDLDLYYETVGQVSNLSYIVPVVAVMEDGTALDMDLAQTDAWTKEIAPTLKGASSDAFAPLASCVFIKLGSGASLPGWVPVIGGRYKFEVNGQGCVDQPKCDLNMSAGLRVDIKFTKRVTGIGVAALGASWETDEKSCQYVFKGANLTVSAKARGRIPLWKPPIKVPLCYRTPSPAI